MDKFIDFINTNYQIHFDKNQMEISILVQKILNTTDDQKIDTLTTTLISVITKHLDSKKSCNKEHGPDYSACFKRVIIEEYGFKLIEKTLTAPHTNKELQQVIRGWFRDNFWMIEAECLRCGR